MKRYIRSSDVANPSPEELLDLMDEVPKYLNSIGCKYDADDFQWNEKTGTFQFSLWDEKGNQVTDPYRFIFDPEDELSPEEALHEWLDENFERFTTR